MRFRALILGLIGAIAGLVAVGPGFCAEIHLPQTAEEHRALASRYDQKAAAATQEAAEHRAMLDAAYKAEIHSKAPVRRAYEKMRKHCRPIVRDAERLAKDYEAFAAWHRLRAEEVLGASAASETHDH
ncbi:MAG: hypothetical protein COV75_01200 [Candidatus Omnitrophica bacterium CG11_big_fil_rev_8_21_14_0_20_63_9]|nr:MAG: hypothetical protein COV75_01200 [Candidatus Omnitrophica bacterium CG11_big_fil_rev_8_21_14_0_20_63_9]